MHDFICFHSFNLFYLIFLKMIIDSYAEHIDLETRYNYPAANYL